MTYIVSSGTLNSTIPMDRPRYVEYFYVAEQ